jgi:sugar/nucleoside kinase (ribokinase family)
MKKEYDLISIGNALLDITVDINEKTLSELGLKKGEMKLINSEEQLKILAKINHLKPQFSSGGSSANTAFGIMTLGGKSAFIGKVGNDDFGKEYAKGLKKSGVTGYLSKDDELSTGTAITFITPDGERSFATYLGAASKITPEEIKKNILEKAEIIHIEGYLFDIPGIKEGLPSVILDAKK